MPAKVTTPREHGTRARYMMGATGSDTSNGCRCAPCRKANAIYSKRRAIRAARVGAAHIDSTEVRNHIAWLRANSIGRRSIAELAGVDRSTVRRLTVGQATVHRDVAARILRLNLANAADRRRWLPVEPTRRLIDGLVADGWSRARIALALGQQSKALTIASYGHEHVTARSAAKVDALVRREAPHVWRQVHEQLAAERERSDRRAESAELKRERDRIRKRATRQAAA